MNAVIQIENDSEAFTRLQTIFALDHTYCVRIHVEDDTHIKVKRNEGMWSLPLSTTL